MGSTSASAPLMMHNGEYDSGNIGTLGKLPPEIRRQIFRLCFGRRQLEFRFDRGRQQPGRWSKDYRKDLLRVSKAMYAEAKPTEAFAPVKLLLYSHCDSFPGSLSTSILDLVTCVDLRTDKMASLVESDLQLCPNLQELRLTLFLRKAKSTFCQREGTIDDLVKGGRDHALIQHVQQQVLEDADSNLEMSLVPEHVPLGVPIVLRVMVKATMAAPRDRLFNLVRSHSLGTNPIPGRNAHVFLASDHPYHRWQLDAD